MRTMTKHLPTLLSILFIVAISAGMTLVLSDVPQAQVGVTSDDSYDVFAFETLTVSTTALPFTSATRANARMAFCSVEGGEIRYRMDGTDPTSAIGHLTAAAVSNTLTVMGINNVRNFRMIRATVDATVRCSYSK